MPPSQVALWKYLRCQNSTTVKMELGTNVMKCSLVMKMHLNFPLFLYLDKNYVRPQMIVHAYMIKIDWTMISKKKIVKLYVRS